MNTTRPYLLRAIYEWAEDNQLTAQLLVDATQQGVMVPREFVQDGQIMLNVASSAIKLELMDNEWISFSARFSGASHQIEIPISAVLAIFARENGQGLFFNEPDEQPGSSEGSPDKSPESKPEKPDRSHLKLIK